MKLYVCSFSFAKQIFPLVERKIYGEEKSKKKNQKKKTEKKAECGAQESTETELYWVHKSVTIGKWVLKMARINTTEWGSLFCFHYSKNASERTTHGKI